MKKNLVYIIILFLTISLLSGFSGFKKYKNIVEYETVNVTQGDTLWNIAKENISEKEDIRDYIYMIRKVNNLESVNIHPGDQLLIPVYEKE
ncbi:LysM peptidoglycan-binding domain-containing protein [Tepidibacter hydrothermalis]|uniref:LysM peptidoglycan-binding domain-containing protein n=1 Tax=Tepidibacter hydrothermalis TaxID=3036126 RepID=A0ABY8EGH0_9FIRM|nr:LysM peptidoglycan-binding domain-containing protein [Tepidibacter hydrothermalis]WFD12039.1 LysM peptidoglycan-binding domain-containing protein [Tepidibacter hydrothermalis]